MNSSTLNGGETVYQGSWVPAVSCALIADEAIELLELIDQPSYWIEEQEGE